MYKFIGWDKWEKLTPRERWDELQKIDRLSYTHAAAWIENAIAWTRAKQRTRAIAHMRVARSQMCMKDREILLKEIVAFEKDD